MSNEEQPNSSHDSCHSKLESPPCVKMMPQFKRWILIFSLIILGVTSVLLVGFTISGHIIQIQSLECGSAKEDAALLQSQSSTVYGLMVPCFVASLIGLLGVRRNNTAILKLFAGMMLMLSLSAFVFFAIELDTHAKMREHFKTRYLGLMPLTEINDTQEDCNYLQNIYRWQTEYKCCGLVDGYQDWGDSIPDSCLCEEGIVSFWECVEVRNNTTLSSEYKLAYEKPCLPVLLAHLGHRWASLIGILVSLACIFIIVSAICSPFIIVGLIICSTVIGKCCFEKLIHIGEEKMIPVIYIKKLKTTTLRRDKYETEEEKTEEGGLRDGTTAGDEDNLTKDPAEDGDKQLEEGVQDKGAEEGTIEEGNTEEQREQILSFIPESELRRLQEELEPPPAKGHTECLCLLHNKSRPFYVIQLDEGSPLLPSGAVLIDAAKSRSNMFWVKGHHFIPAPGKLPGVDYEVDSQPWQWLNSSTPPNGILQDIKF